MDKKDFLNLAVPAIAGLPPYQPGRDIETVKNEYGLKTVIKLASNENAMGPGLLAREAMAAYEPDDIGRYPDNHCLRLKDGLAKQNGLSPEQFIVGNGSNEILNIIVRALVPADTDVLFPRYSFIVFPLATLAVGARPKEAPDHDYGTSVDALLEAVTPRTRLLMLANPNNPTGHYLTGKMLRRLLEQLPEHVVTVVDQAYSEYMQSVSDYTDAMKLLSDFPRLIITGTFSKVHGLAALRVGYAACHPELAELLNRCREPFNVNAMAQVAASAALNDQEHVQASLALTLEGRRQWLKAFSELDLPHLPSPANFVCVKVPGGGKQCCQDMEKKGVILRPLDNYGMPDWLRVSFGLIEENTRAITAFQQWLNERG